MELTPVAAHAMVERPPGFKGMMPPVEAQISNAKASMDLVAPVPPHDVRDMACNFEIWRQSEDRSRLFMAVGDLVRIFAPELTKAPITTLWEITTITRELDAINFPLQVDVTHATHSDKYPNLRSVPLRLVFPVRISVSLNNYPNVVTALRFAPYLNGKMNPLIAGMPGTDIKVINACVSNAK